MKKTAVVVAALLAALFSLSIGGPAYAYPEPVISVGVSSDVLPPGGTFVVTGSSPHTCAWTVTFNGHTYTSTGTHLNVHLTAPSTPGHYPVVVTCLLQDGPNAGETVVRSLTITVQAPVAGGPAPTSSVLPEAGGPARALLYGGAGLVVLGAIAMLVARRRRERQTPA